ncbi:MAG: cysteine hydrolase family protein [Pseudomonadota bacterium]
MGQGLLLIDIQNDYFPGGTMELVGIDNASRNAGKVLGKFRDRGAPIFHVQHLSVRPGATFFVPGTQGCEINDMVKPLDGEIVIQKNFPNAFRDTDLENMIREKDVEELVICGAMSHMCIDASTRAAFDLGFTCKVVEDACATRDLEFGGNDVSAEHVHRAFMAALNGIYATVSNTAESV